MSAFLFFAALACMIGVLVSLVCGVVAMTRGRQQDHATSNKMMRLRIILQGLAILLLFLSSASK